MKKNSLLSNELFIPKSQSTVNTEEVIKGLNEEEQEEENPMT